MEATASTQKIRYIANAANFSKIPGSPVAYWVGLQGCDCFANNKKLGSVAVIKHGMSTGKNEVFVRIWSEVNYKDIDFSINDRVEISRKSLKYYPYNKGGEYRKWYGNAAYVLWYNIDGQKQMEMLSGHRHDGKDYYFHEGITWSFISSSNFGVRYTPGGFVFDVAGSSMFPNVNIYYVCAFLCSCLAPYFLDILNPTLNFQVGNISSLPYIEGQKATVVQLSQECVVLSKTDWDSFETSWDFKRHPLV